MLTILSPAKKLNFEKQHITSEHTLPDYLDKSVTLMNKLKKLSKKDIIRLMDLSDNLAAINHERFQSWDDTFTKDNAKQAVLAFNGEVYTGLDAKSLSEAELLYAQEHFRILSGLHGILRPLDLIKPYRLEMGTKLSGRGYKDLNNFWKKVINNELTNLLQKEKVLVNLASNEYTKPIDIKGLNARVITPKFKDYKNGAYKSLFLFVKHSRGMMARFILKNKIEDPENLKHFEENGYFFNDKMSSEDEFVFTRG